MEQIFDDVSDNLALCLQITCIIELWIHMLCKKFEAGITSFTVMLPLACECESYKLFLLIISILPYISYLSVIIIQNDNLTCDK